jgi:adenylate cyclase
VGDEKRMSGTVIGNAVNVASRMVSLTKMYGVRLITSKIAIQKMMNKELKGIASPFVFRELDRVKVVGKSTVLELFEVLEPTSPVLRIKEQFEKGLSLYRDKKFEEALRYFAECMLLVPLDRPSAMFIERCQTRKTEGVPEDWKAVETLLVK